MAPWLPREGESVESFLVATARWYPGTVVTVLERDGDEPGLVVAIESVPNFNDGKPFEIECELIDVRPLSDALAKAWPKLHSSVEAYMDDAWWPARVFGFVDARRVAVIFDGYPDEDHVYSVEELRRPEPSAKGKGKGKGKDRKEPGSMSSIAEDDVADVIGVGQAEDDCEVGTRTEAMIDAQVDADVDVDVDGEDKDGGMAEAEIETGEVESAEALVAALGLALDDKLAERSSDEASNEHTEDVFSRMASPRSEAGSADCPTGEGADGWQKAEAGGLIGFEAEVEAEGEGKGEDEDEDETESGFDATIDAEVEWPAVADAVDVQIDGKWVGGVVVESDRDDGRVLVSVGDGEGEDEDRAVKVERDALRRPRKSRLAWPQPGDVAEVQTEPGQWVSAAVEQRKDAEGGARVWVKFEDGSGEGVFGMDDVRVPMNVWPAPGGRVECYFNGDWYPRRCSRSRWQRAGTVW
ncbi:uncharacterized protein AMSG_11827 [Thecamonas trahens ATCC 50062]|uniref:Tudor domain-containing protein n=1 Tax=Thecamonas trahens ATCC 50062 TaxID=461836 RepID=A0A0L0D836_THETB|nr:hypothetical protein AMSG_11827 [Thecamonas trahens ATCC 50062]KNC48375.1 hypothetical protein AMSG_11827 [Thecamonas trahens ATCC 50062]|eukprot:XP_013758662.1 hypothetical protein AMSG_11827 [Thecamonas trahens ATCC 50062]